MSKFKDSESHTTTEYQATVLDPNLGEATQVQCANCGSWRANSRLYCPVCGGRNVQSQSVFLSEEQMLAKSNKLAEELKASVREPEKDSALQRRRNWLIAGFVVLFAAGLWWAHQERQAVQEAKQEAQAVAAQAAADKEKALALAAEQARAAASAAQAAEAAIAAASAAVAAASTPVMLSDEQATKLGLSTPAPKRKPEPPPIVVSAPVVAPPVIVASEPEPPKPEPVPVVVPKVETPQERLTNALAACKARGGFFEKNACEFEARKRLCPPLEGKTRDCPVQNREL